MSGFRAAWLVLAAVAVAFTTWAASLSVSNISLSCSKTGRFSDSNSGIDCGDSILHAQGVWPVILLGLLLVVPAVAAAVTVRRWVSWVATGGFAALFFVGVSHWSEFFGLLMAAGVLAIIAFLITLAQQILTL